MNMEQFNQPEDWLTNPTWGGFYESDGWMWWGGNALRRNVAMAYTRLRGALKFCPKFDLAFDVGASMGLYTFFLSMHFGRVESFEPFIKNQEAFQYNSKNFCKSCVVNLHPVGVSDMEDRLSMMAESTGSTVYCDGKPGLIKFISLDSLELSPDFIKIDAEGMDLKVLHGAKETIARCHPTIMIEDTRTDNNKPIAEREHELWYKEGEIPEFLSKYGYELKKRMGIDFIYG